VFSPEDLPAEIGDGQYLLTRLLDDGRDAALHFAEVQLERFDFDELISFHLRRGNSRDRKRKPASGAGEPDTPRGVCRRLGLPYPRDLRAAIKSVPDDLSTERRGLFEAEWQELIAFYHPNLVTVYGGGESNGLLWYAMEVLPARRSMTQLSALSEQELLELVAQAADGLQALHNRQLVHGDVRPSKLAVFGRAGRLLLRVIEPVGDKLSGSGSPYYQSPAGIWGDRVGRRGDIYSLGATLYRLLGGQPPYDGCELEQIEQKLADGEGPAPLSSLRSDLGPQTQTLVKRMMAIDPNRRLQSMKEVRGVIKGILSEDRFAVSRLLDPKKKRRDPPPVTGPRKPAMPLSHVMGISFAVIVSILVLGFMVSVLAGGSTQPDADEDSPPPKQAEVSQQPVPTGPAKTGDDGLIEQLAILGDRARRLAGQGKLEQCQTLLDQLADLAMSREDSTSVARAYERWQGKIGKARASYLAGLADRAASALKRGKKTKGRKLIERLKRLSPEHERLPDLEDLLDK